ncbi:MAG: radical SAM protein [Thermoplasmatota archaeon]
MATWSGKHWTMNDRAAYLQCKRIPVSFSSDDDMEALWEEHDAAMHRRPGEQPGQSLLDLKLELARRIYHDCHFCERRCHVDRAATQGYCDVGDAAVASEFLHYGEEPMLVPSHTIFFTGCTFTCIFCQNWDISQRQSGMYVRPEQLAAVIEQRDGVNVNWVGGDPTPNVPYILATLRACSRDVPQVWNSNMYCSHETMRLLDHVMDVYLTDFKYGSDTCAAKLSDAPEYWDVVTRNHCIAAGQGDLVVRHLVMPNHVECCSLPILEWLADNVPEASVNVMDQYRPCYQASEHPGIDRRIRREEYRRVAEYAREQGLHLVG